MSTVNVEIRGDGPVGQELNTILPGHPEIGEVSLIGRQDKPSEDADAYFLALPHGESAATAEKLVKLGKKVLDLSGDLRFPRASDYEKWYGIKHHPTPGLLPVPYGLPEINREEIAGQSLVSVPGCYPTAALLGILPFIRNGFVENEDEISVVAFSGYSGAGKMRDYEEQDDIEFYDIGHRHRHVGEMEQFTNGRRISFSPAIIKNISRGLVVHSTLDLGKPAKPSVIEEVLEYTYRNEPFVSVKSTDKERQFNLDRTIGKDICTVGAVATKNKILVVSNLDNLRKGSAAQAVQNFNLMFGFDETTGLTPKND